MTTKTRYFLLGSAGILVVGLCTGLVAFYAGFPTIALSRGGPEELRFIPSNASVVAYANVRDVMLSDFRKRLKEYAPHSPDGQEKFKQETGIDIENDIDRVVACIITDQAAAHRGFGLVLASGRFDTVRLEAVARGHGAVVEEYRTKRILRMADKAPTNHPVVLAFMAPGLIGLGSAELVKQAIDRQTDATKDSIADNKELIRLVEDMNDGNAWVVGRFDVLTANAKLPTEVSSRLPAITWFAASGHVNGGITGRLRAEARDEQAANDLREVLRGFMALARMQSGSNPEIQSMMQALDIGGTGNTVSLSFSVPAEVLDMLAPKKKVGGAEREQQNPEANPR